ncbi:MAG: DMT family transporter [Promethearchaeota archaeon]
MDHNTKKGLIFGAIGVFFVGFQPIVAIARPESLDAFIFAAMTCLVEASIFLPLMYIELNVSKSKFRENDYNSQLPDISIWNNWKKNLSLLIFIGIIFALNQLLFFIGYGLAGAVNGSLTQKTSIFFGLLFGYIILKERFTRIQIIFSLILFLGLMIAISGGTFLFSSETNIEIILGVLILLFITCLWMFGHTMTKPLFKRDEITPIQMVFLRNILSGVILITIYFFFFPVENFKLFLNPINVFFFVFMGTVYGIGLFSWYKTLSYLEVSKATIVLSPTPIVSAIFATLILGEAFTLFHLIGTIIIIISIIIIVNQKRDET